MGTVTAIPVTAELKCGTTGFGVMIGIHLTIGMTTVGMTTVGITTTGGMTGTVVITTLIMPEEQTHPV